jgi:rare lipoprotein A (peptidoglycan hydrolase)
VRRRTATGSALLAALLLTGGGTGAADVRAADLPRLEAELAVATAQVRQLTTALEQAAAQDAGLRVAADRLAEQAEAEQGRLDVRVRELYMAGDGTEDPLAGLATLLGGPDLRVVALSGTARAQDALLADAHAQALRTAELARLAAAHRDRLRGSAAAVLAAQDRARGLLARAEALGAAQQARTEQAQRDRAALAASRALLDDLSASVTRALTPAQTARGVAAARGQGSALAVVEAAGADYPRGYRPTGVEVRGLASWYGPGFVGSPTASGAPYDPERLTCASKELPLGTVLRVTYAGRSVSCLVNDRGPYVGDRVLDLSRAASRALGYDGVVDVVAEVLALRP